MAAAHPITGPGAAPRQPRVAVIGASLTGPAVALLLLQAGIEHVTVYEATPAGVTLGGGLISLEHSSLGILDRLGIDQPEYIHTPSETIWQTPVDQRMLGTPVRRCYPGRCTTWTRLHEALLRRLPTGMLHSRRRITGLDTRDGRPWLSFADGCGSGADLVIFADGRASTGRRLLDPGRTLRYAGYIGHRGTTVGVEPGITDFWRLEPGPGVQLNLGPVPGGLDWTFYLNGSARQYQDWFGSSWQRRLFAHAGQVSAAARDRVDAAAAHLLPARFARIVQAAADRAAFAVIDIDAPTRMVWPVGDGHAVLLGDALAPARAHTARGANNGLEQADALVTAVLQHVRYGADLTTALAGWQRRQLPAAVAAVQRGPAIGARLGLGHRAAARPPVPAGTSR
ncbi:monooxygenase [Actinoplanes sp. CA-030573]|uniref:monooxygenase n=1 Tax=Actinoplanes sp. CA-030573 TaxID=3239898 RepID=UPI003D91C5C5